MHIYIFVYTLLFNREESTHKLNETTEAHCLYRRMIFPPTSHRRVACRGGGGNDARKDWWEKGCEIAGD